MSVQATVLVGKSRIRTATPVECLNCQKTFLAATCEVKRGNGKFCSNSCTRSYQRIDYFAPCLYCGEMIQERVAKDLKRHIYCSKRCGILWRSTNGRPKTKGNAHYKARQMYYYYYGEVKCERLLCRHKKDRVHIHHKDHNEYNNKIDNLQALCYTHHMKHHAGDSSWFQPKYKGRY